MRLDGDRMEIIRLSLQTGDSDLRVKGTVANWMRAPRATLHLESDRLEFRSLAAGEHIPPPAGRFLVLHRWLTEGEVEAIVFIERASHDQLLLTGLSCAVRMKHGQLTIDRISGDTNRGHLSGRIVSTYWNPASDRRTLHFGERSSLASAAHAVRAGGSYHRMAVAGRTSSCRTGSVGHRHDDAVDSQTIRVIVEDGSVKNVPLISNLLKILNLPALLQGKVDLTRDGLPFKSIQGCPIHSKWDGVGEGVVSRRPDPQNQRVRTVRSRR